MQKKLVLGLLGLLLFAAAVASVRAQSSSSSFEEDEDELAVEQDEQQNSINNYPETDTDDNENDDDDDDDDDDYNPREALMKHLFGGTKNSKWAKKVPPPAKYLPVLVQVKMRPLHIDWVCTKTYHIKMPVLESYNWTDPRLAWNESQFDGIKSISVDACDIWMPDIGVYQSPDAFPTATRPKQFRPIIYSSGVVTYMPRTKFIIACSASAWNNNVTTTTKNSNNKSYGNATSSSIDAAVSQKPASDDDSSNKTQTFVCEFDQGSWSNDMSVIDIVPILEGGLAASKGAKKILTLSEQQKLKSRSAASNNSKTFSKSSKPTGKNQRSQQQQKLSKNAQKSKATTTTSIREYTAKEYNTTSDLSWFEPNQLYSIKSFNVKRLVMQYPAVVSGTWSSMRYRLVVQVRGGGNATTNNAMDLTEEYDDDSKLSGDRLVSSTTTVTPPVVI